MTDAYERIFKTFSFGVLSFLSNFINKYFIFPLIIFYWGNDIFNEWIVVTNIALQFSLFDFGTKIYLGNKLAKKNNKIEYYYKYIALINLISVFCITFCLLSILIFFDFADKFKTLTNTEFSLVITFSTLLIILNIIIGNLGEVTLRPIGLYYKYQKIDFSFNLLISLILVVSLILNAKIVIFTAINFILVFVKFIYLKKYLNNRNIIINDLIIKFNFFNLKKFKIIIFNSFFFYLSNLVNLIQTSTLILVGSIGMGISQIGTFVVHKTLSSISNQISNMLALAFTYEYTKSYLSTNDERLMNYNLKISNYVTISFNIVLYFFAELIFNFWLQSKIQFNLDLFHILLICAVIRNYGSTIANFLWSKNRHVKFNSIILIISILLIPIAYVFSMNYGLMGLSYAYLFYEVIYLIVGFNFLNLHNINFNRFVNFTVEIIKILIFILFIIFNNIYLMLFMIILLIFDLIKIKIETRKHS